MNQNTVISNSLFNTSTASLLLDKPHLKDEEDIPQTNRFSMIATNKVSRPSFNFPKEKIKNLMNQPLMIRRKTANEPIIHYNGPYETLDQLPEDKYSWIVSESFGTDSQTTNPLVDYPKYIVFRKPHRAHAPGIGYQNLQIERPKSKGIFYLRVLQINNPYTTKACHIKPTITIDNEVFYGSYTLSQKYGKFGTQATMDETYLIDFCKESTATFSIHSKTKNVLGSINSHFKRPEKCLGSREFEIRMSPAEKKIERITLKDSNTDEQHQILIIYGTFVSENVMTLLHNRPVYDGYITVYTKGSYTPRWNRYWARLSPECFQLYDFEYKDKRKPACEIPLVSLLDVFNPPIDDDERLVDVGSLGLALQFSDHVLDETEVVSDVLEYRIYILPDDAQRAKEWEESFRQVLKLIKEFRYDSCFDATRFDQHDRSMYISSKFLW
ncbi:unnamed protein product [Rhizopus stolonifer]